MQQIYDVITDMITYYQSDPKRIQHFIKVYSFAKLIGEAEHLAPETLEILEVAAVVHDIGIKVSEEKYKSSAGKYQELEGPPLAEKMLTELKYPQPVVDRVSWLVGHHHTYNNIREIDHQILIEADYLVNIFEDAMPSSAIQNVNERVFKTQTGKWLLNTMFL